MSVRRKSALVKAFDGFLNDAFGTNTTVTPGGRVVKKKPADLTHLTAGERIKQAKRKPVGAAATVATSRSVAVARRQHHNVHGERETAQAGAEESAAGPAQVYFYPDDPGIVPTKYVADAAVSTGARRRYVPPQTKIDSRNRLLRPTVAMAAKHVDGAQLIESLSEGNESAASGSGGGGGGRGQAPKSSMVKKAFRHLHNALTGADTGTGAGGGGVATRVSTREFQRKTEERERLRAAKVDRLRRERVRMEEEVRWLVDWR